MPSPGIFFGCGTEAPCRVKKKRTTIEGTRVFEINFLSFFLLVFLNEKRRYRELKTGLPRFLGSPSAMVSA